MLYVSVWQKLGKWGAANHNRLESWVKTKVYAELVALMCRLEGTKPLLHVPCREQLVSDGTAFICFCNQQMTKEDRMQRSDVRVSN